MTVKVEPCPGALVSPISPWCSSTIFLLMYKPSPRPSGRLLWIIPAAVIYAGSIVVGLVKHGHFGGAHIMEAKLLAVFGYLVVILAMFGKYSEVIYFCMIGSWVLHSLVNLLHHYRPELFNKHQRSLILGLLGIDIEEGAIGYFFS